MNYAIDNELNKINQKNVLNIKDLVNEISKYDNIDFLMSVSALMLFPQNQSKSVIFQSMINAALSIPSKNSQNKMSITTFKKIVKQFEKSSISLMVDPPEFPFVLPILYYENPFVFMGNNSLSPIYLSNILKIFEINKRKINYTQYNEIKNIINGLLSFSNNVVKSLDIKMENLKFFSTEEEIFIPCKSILDNYKEKIIVNFKKMESIFGNKINKYVTEFESIKKDEILCYEEPKFIFKPFVKYNNDYVLLDITCILPLVFRILIKETYELKSINFIEEYNKLNSLELSKKFFMLGCQELNPQGVKLIKDTDYEEKLFLFGNDGIVINIQLFDTGNNFNFDIENSNVIFNRKNDFISQRLSYLSKFAISNAIDSNKIFVVVSPYTLGRDFLYSLKGCNLNNILILSLYELSAISINEENNKFFLGEYIDARKRLNHYKKNLFSELNFVALFSNNGYSFYINDDIDVKDAFISIVGEYSSDYILKSYIRESKKLCNFYKKGSLIEVIKIDRSIYFAPQLFLDKILNKVLMDNNSVIWIINENENMYGYNLYQWMSDLISYWLDELLPFQCDEYNIIINLIIDEKLQYGIRPMQVVDDISKIFKYDIETNTLKLYITEELCNYFNYDTNGHEKEFIKYLLRILSNDYNIHVDKEKIDKVFKNPYKRKTINIDSINDAYMIPSDSKNYNQVSKSQVNIILDEIGLYLKKEKKYDYGIIKDDKVLNYVVDFLYKKLIDDLKKYNKRDLIFYLYKIYDCNLGNLLIRQRYYANDITCYPEHKEEIENNINNMTELSVALKFVIELVSSFKESGNRKVSFYDLNYSIAISSQIIEWAYAGDLLHYEMINSDISFLYSNRIGFDKTSANRINMWMKKSMLSKNSIKGIENTKRIANYLPKITNNDDNFEQAFYSEFGYSFNDYTEVTITILELFQENYDNILEIKIEDVKSNVKRSLSYDLIKKIMDSLSLEEREDFINPPNPYTKEDVYPWRFNRPLSFTRRPLIKNNDLYIVGYRTLINSVYYLLSIINEGIFHAYSKEMKDYVSKRNNIKGRTFNDHVYNYMSNFDSLIVKKNVKKINKKNISDENNNTLGDIDILYISIKKKTIGIIETKHFNISKNYYEIHNEYKEMFDVENPKCFYVKHKKRVDWVKIHIDDIVKEFNLPKLKWRIKDMFVVEDYLISKKAFKVNVNIHTLKDLTESDLY